MDPNHLEFAGLIWLWCCIALAILGSIVLALLQLRRPPGSPAPLLLRHPYLLGLLVAGLGVGPNLVLNHQRKQHDLQQVADVAHQYTDALESFRAALQNRAGPRLWDMLDLPSKQKIEKAAAQLKADYQKAPADLRQKMTQKLDLTAAELETLIPNTYLQSRLFLDRYLAVVQGKERPRDVKPDTVIFHFEVEDRQGKRTEDLRMIKVNDQWLLTVTPPPLPLNW